MTSGPAATERAQDATAARAAARGRDGAALAPSTAAWVALLPCALLTVALVALLGPPLGRAFLGPGPDVFWAEIVPSPEPEEHGRYLLSLLGPALLATAVLLSARWSVRASAATARRLALAAQLLLVAFLAVCVAAQYDVLLSAWRPQWDFHARYFTLPTLLVALALAALPLVLMRRASVAARVARLVRETPARRIVAALLAVLLTATWLLTAVATDASLANTAHAFVASLPTSMDEPFAILDGRTPLVDFHPQYGQLVPYLAAATMALFGASIGTFTATMALGSGLALLALFDVLRRVARSSMLALLLYLPLLASGFFMQIGPLEDRYGPASLASLWPIRYGGPYLLAWLLARQLERARAGRDPHPWPLFLCGGLVLVNNPDFGAGACAALVAALLLARPPRSRAAAGRLLAEAAGGLLGALALVALLTLVRSGELPDFGAALEFSRLYGIDGFAMVPLPRIGLYLAVYVTFAAAIVVAAVRLARREPDVLLTGMLAWSGTFGLLAGAYFAGRSHPHVLIDLFSPWALSLALLTVVALQSLAARAWRRPTLPELAVLFGFGLLACSLAQTPTPWSQLERIRDDAPVSILKQAEATAFVAERTQAGERIAILIPLGHRIAYDTDRTNVAPYSSIQSMPTTQQLGRAIAALRREGGNKLFISSAFTSPQIVEAIERAGFAAQGEVVEGASTIRLLVDGAAR